MGRLREHPLRRRRNPQPGVLALLDAARRAPKSFLAQPAMHLTARQLMESAASLPGTQLGPYRVGARIGSGGMGTVYEAHDSRLHRKVAIKLLPPAFTRRPPSASHASAKKRAPRRN